MIRLSIGSVSRLGAALCGLFLFPLISGPARAATVHVAPTGSDTAGDGSAAAPYATPQKGLDAAGPGDTVHVHPGVYRGAVTFRRSGTEAARVTLEGEPGAVLDAGVSVAGWEADPAMGKAGVFRKRTADLPFEPFQMIWNDKYVMRLSQANEKLKPADAYFARLTAPPDDKSWDGLEALFGTRDGFTYVRFRDRQDPNRETLTFGKNPHKADSGVVNAPAVRFVTVRGLTLKGGGTGVNVCRGASDVRVEGNLILHGSSGVFVNGYGTPPDPCHRVVVRDNRITLNYLADLGPSNPLHDYIWAQFKEAGDKDRRGVYLYYAGDDCEVANNEIYQHWDGVQDSAGGATRGEYAAFCRRLKVHHNTIRDVADDAMEPTGGEVGAEWHDNLITDALIGLRLKDVKAGPCYVYRNRIHSGAGGAGAGGRIGPRDIYFFAGSDAAVFVYHNTFASDAGLVMGSTSPQLGLPHTWFINNVFSNARFWAGGDRWKMDPHAHTNWCGGDVKAYPWLAADNLCAPGRRFWGDDASDFRLTADSPARGRGIDLSKPATLDGETIGPLPGMSPGYFHGDKPDLGAVQHE